MIKIQKNIRSWFSTDDDRDYNPSTYKLKFNLQITMKEWYNNHIWETHLGLSFTERLHLDCNGGIFILIFIFCLCLSQKVCVLDRGLWWWRRRKYLILMPPTQLSGFKSVANSKSNQVFRNTKWYKCNKNWVNV